MNYTVLYRKYRPKKFSDIVGQDVIVNILTNQIKSGKISHAYLFCGIRGTGKTSTAKIFAKAIACLNNNEDGEPCNECASCKSINDGASSDIIEIDAASNRSIDGIRTLKEEVNLMPVFGKYKVYIIDEIHMLTTEAFNALLKTLEEPPKHVVFIFATTEVNKVLPTILSRCQRFDFSRISKEDIVKHLCNILDELNIEYEIPAIEEIAISSEGALRDALSILDKAINVSSDTKINLDLVRDVLGLARREELYNICDGILKRDIDLSLLSLNEAILSGKESDSVLMQIIEYFRDKIVAISVDEPKKVLSKSDEYIEKLTKDYSGSEVSKRICDILMKLSKLKNDMRFFSNPQYLLEAKIIELCLDNEEDKSILEEKKGNTYDNNTGSLSNIDMKEINILNEKINALEKSIALLENKINEGNYQKSPGFEDSKNDSSDLNVDISSISLEDSEKIDLDDESMVSMYPDVTIENGVIMVEEDEVREIINLLKKCSQYITNRYRDPLISQMVNVLKPVSYKDGVATVVFTNYFNLIMTFNELNGRELLNDTIKQLYDKDLKIVYMKGRHEVRFKRDKNRKSRLGDEIKKSLEEENKNIKDDIIKDNDDLGSLSYDVRDASVDISQSSDEEYLSSFDNMDIPAQKEVQFEESIEDFGFTEMED